MRLNNSQKKKMKQKMEEIVQNSEYTKEELSLISNTFYERDDILMALKKHFLQGELLAHEQSTLGIVTGNVLDVVRKQLLPEIDPSAPFHQTRDLWTHINTNDKLVEDSYLDMKAQDIAIKYLDQQFYRLENDKDIGNINFKDLIYNDRKDAQTAFIELKARNLLLPHIDAHLEKLRQLAISNADTDYSEKERAMLNSNK